MTRWVGLAEACEHYGKSQRTIYSWVQQGRIEKRATPDGTRYQIECEDAADPRETSADLQQALHAQLADVTGQRDAAQARCESLQQDLADTRKAAEDAQLRSDTNIQTLIQEIGAIRQLALPPATVEKPGWFARVLAFRL